MWYQTRRWFGPKIWQIHDEFDQFPEWPWKVLQPYTLIVALSIGPLHVRVTNVGTVSLSDFTVEYEVPEEWSVPPEFITHMATREGRDEVIRPG